ncbi:MAG: preprotein translocase subunit SecG [Tannerella sp.]|jgi:preprotein translocase subunit SecG|nr:preprotein translocase subunit SecG [Tannerella sp.]
MYVFLSILILIASIFLILIVLIQNSKGGGLASGFSSSNQIMGVRKTTDFLEKATWALAGIVGVFCIVITAIIPHDANTSGQPQSEIQQQVNESPVPNTALPFGTSQPDESATTVPPAEEQ